MEKVMKIPMPEDNVFDDIEYIMNKMERLQNLMLNKDIVSLRIVTTPEKIVIKEAKRNFTCLHLYNYNVDAIIVNKIYPKEAMEGYFSKWIKMQDEGLKEIEESFSEVPRYYLELQKGEIRNIEVLEKVGDELFEDDDFTKVLFKKDIFTIEKSKESTIMRILLPFADKRELDLRQDKNEIVLSVKNETRRFPLPVDLYDKEITGAKFIDGYLLINF